MINKSGCLVCGKELIFFDSPRILKCSECGREISSNASCQDGHFICNECHAKKAVSESVKIARESVSKNPVEIIKEMMRCPFVHMHGNEHHVMVGLSLMAAFRNAGGQIDFEKAAAEMQNRGSKYPGGSCGFWGACGAAVSTGMFMSIITGSTPLSENPWSLSNEITARGLLEISKIGGPRCCKRNSFTAIKNAVLFCEEKLGVKMELPEQLRCEFSEMNAQCRKEKCPYFTM